MKITLKEAYHNFLKTINVGKLDVKLFDLITLLESVKINYLDIEILGLDLNNPECDMLLFQYGNYDWAGDGEKFNLSVKRQLFFKNLDECGFYGFYNFFY